MTTYYAVHLTASQGKFDCLASCSLVFSTDQGDTTMTLVWPDMPPQADPENPGEWLFHVLEELVTNFDAHEVRGAERKPRTPLQEL